MRIAFAGTPEFARASLAALHAAGHEIALVLTQPDRPAGRGLKLQPSPVKAYALAHDMPVAQPRSLRLDGRFAADAAAAQTLLNDLAPELMVVAAYGLLLPPWVLEGPAGGCVNVHGSLLPRWRGAAPIQRAIEAGDTMSGITIMQMDAGLDTGATLLAEPLALAPDETAASLHDRLGALGGRLIVQALTDLPRLVPQPQPATGVTYARKIDKAEAAIDWRRSAVDIERQVRAFDPFPGCTLEWQGQTLKLWRAAVLPQAPGVAVGQAFEPAPGRIAVACGDAALELLQLQPAGRRRMAAAEYLRGHG